MLLAAIAALPTILGLQLGAPPAVPECHRMVTQYAEPDGGPPPYQTQQDLKCIMHDTQRGNGVEDGVIVFPIDAMPTLMGFNWVTDRLIGGRIGELGIATLDYNHADYVVAQLTEKFGQPDEDRASMQDFDSIAVPSRLVIWKRPGFRAEYRSVGESIERGHILIQTDEALAIRAQEDAATKAKQTPF